MVKKSQNLVNVVCERPLMVVSTLQQVFLLPLNPYGLTSGRTLIRKEKKWQTGEDINLESFTRYLSLLIFSQKSKGACKFAIWKALNYTISFIQIFATNRFLRRMWKFLGGDTVWPEPIWIKVNSSWVLPPQHQSKYLRGSESASIEIPPFRPKFT